MPSSLDTGFADICSKYTPPRGREGGCSKQSLKQKLVPPPLRMLKRSSSNLSAHSGFSRDALSSPPRPRGSRQAATALTNPPLLSPSPSPASPPEPLQSLRHPSLALLTAFRSCLQSREEEEETAAARRQRQTIPASIRRRRRRTRILWSQISRGINLPRQRIPVNFAKKPGKAGARRCSPKSI